MQWVDIAVLLLHVLGAAVWAGGLLVLALAIIPRTSADQVAAYVASFARIAWIALALQFVTGLWLLYPHIRDAEGGARIHVIGLLSLKAFFYLATLSLALETRMRIMPRPAADAARPLARRVIAATVLAVLLVISGLGFRVGPETTNRSSDTALVTP